MLCLLLYTAVACDFQFADFTLLPPFKPFLRCQLTYQSMDIITQEIVSTEYPYDWPWLVDDSDQTCVFPFSAEKSSLEFEVAFYIPDNITEFSTTVTGVDFECQNNMPMVFTTVTQDGFITPCSLQSYSSSSCTFHCMVQSDYAIIRIRRVGGKDMTLVEICDILFNVP